MPNVKTESYKSFKDSLGLDSHFFVEIRTNVYFLPDVAQNANVAR